MASKLEQLCQRLGLEAPDEGIEGELVAEGRYRLCGELGAGAQADVVLVVDRHLGREVALKMLRAEDSSDPDILRQFVTEARFTGALEHPNIVPTYELGLAPEKNTLYFALRRLPGTTLHDALQQERLSIFRRLLVFVDVCRAIEHAHARGVLHTDLKPENIFIGEGGEVLVGDWGLARKPGEGAGDFAGTPLYMSPEQVRSEALDERTDIWSLGVLLYELMTGEMPFEGGSLEALLEAVLSDPVPSEIGDKLVPREVNVIIAGCLRRDRAGRSASVTGVRQAVEQVIEGTRAREERQRRLDEAVQRIESAEQDNLHAAFQAAFEIAPDELRLRRLAAARYWSLFKKGLEPSAVPTLVSLAQFAGEELVPGGDAWIAVASRFVEEQPPDPRYAPMRRMLANLRTLRSSPLFADTDAHDLLALAQAAERQRLDAGAILFEAGAADERWFCVAKGSIQVLVGHRVVNVMEPGDAFGEIALLLGRPRTATARAGADGAECLVLDSTRFRQVIGAHGDVAWAVMCVLAKRLAGATEREAELQKIVV